jgi:hypothetical protein
MSLDVELIIAATIGDADRVMELLRRGANVNARVARALC